MLAGCNDGIKYGKFKKFLFLNILISFYFTLHMHWYPLYYSRSMKCPGLSKGGCGAQHKALSTSLLCCFFFYYYYFIILRRPLLSLVNLLEGCTSGTQGTEWPDSSILLTLTLCLSAADLCDDLVERISLFQEWNQNQAKLLLVTLLWNRGAACQMTCDLPLILSL